MKTLENNKLITEFMGYRLAKGNNGWAWESPFEKAIGKAVATNMVNGNSLIIAITPKVNSTTPLLDYFKNQKRLDQ